MIHMIIYMILTICAVGVERESMTLFRGDCCGEFGALMFLACAKRHDIYGYDMILNISYCGDIKVISTTFYL